MLYFPTGRISNYPTVLDDTAVTFPLAVREHHKILCRRYIPTTFRVIISQLPCANLRKTAMVQMLQCGFCDSSQSDIGMLSGCGRAIFSYWSITLFNMWFWKRAKDPVYLPFEVSLSRIGFILRNHWFNYHRNLIWTNSSFFVFLKNRKLSFCFDFVQSTNTWYALSTQIYVWICNLAMANWGVYPLANIMFQAEIMKGEESIWRLIRSEDQRISIKTKDSLRGCSYFLIFLTYLGLRLSN